MKKQIKTAAFLLFCCFVSVVCFAKPENSHLLGNNWYCDGGFRKQGNKCVELIVPKGAHVLGNNWYCDNGFRKQGNKCVELIVPKGAHVLGNNWYCDNGFRKQGSSCIKFQIPKNASALGQNWYCNKGYKKHIGNCIRMSPAELAIQKKLKAQQMASMTDGTIAYQTRIDTDKGDVIKLENGAIVEVSSYFGYLGYRKTAVLYGSGSKCNLWIEGKKSYKCELLKIPDKRGEPAREIHISEVKGNGTILMMLDGRMYEVDSMDEIHTSLWLGISDGLLIGDTTLINFDSDEPISVSRIK